MVPGVREKENLTSYRAQILAAFEVPFLYSVLAAFSTWLLLAGYVLCPSAYGVIKSSQAVHDAGKTGEIILITTRNIPAAVLAAGICLFALVVLFTLWIRQKSKYVWVSRQIFT